MHRDRTYRHQIQTPRLASFRVAVKETDLFISATQPLNEIAREAVLRYRAQIESFIGRYPDFLTALVPWKTSEPMPKIISDMVDAGVQAGVGPMAAVAGVMAQYVGTEVLQHSQEVIVENGGDVFIKSLHPVVIGIFANRSPLSRRVGLRIDPQKTPIAVCTSSGTVGHSLSLGKADAACVVSASCALADAAATAIGNRVQHKGDIAAALEIGKKIKKVTGIVIIKDDKIGMWGDLELVSIKEKKVEF